MSSKQSPYWLMHHGYLNVINIHM